jgi:opacity protein-like surface antigen
MRVLKALVLCGVVALVCAPTQARADGYVSPWAGVNFGSAGDIADAQPIRSCGVNDCGTAWSWGLNAGYMGAGIIGGELEFGWAPKFFGDVVGNHVMDLMGNVIVGVPVGGTHGPGIRPYVTGGLGMMRSSMDAIGTTPETSDNDFAYNLGGGVMGYFSDHVGLRGDVRYLRTLNADSSSDSVSLGLGNFYFWRTSFGVVIR